MDIAKIRKAVAGAAAGGLLGVGTTVVVPTTVDMPWWGYIAAGLINAAITGLAVYLAPRNSPPAS